MQPDEFRRYARQMILPEMGQEGQERLRSASVLCVGAGGLGSPVAMYLAAAGVGRLGLVEFDRVDLSNLQRQVLHGTSDVGRLKVESARETLRELNPHVRVEVHPAKLTAANVMELVRAYDLVVDGTDNFTARYLVNDACVLLAKTNVYGAVLRFEGQASVFAPQEGGPCYRCLFPEPPPPELAPSCAEAGVLGVVPGLIGLLQATETLKQVLGIGESLVGRLMVFDALRTKFRELSVRRDPQCAVCGETPTIRQPVEVGASCASGVALEPEAGTGPAEVGVQDMQRVLQNPGSGIVVLDVREVQEHQVGMVEGMKACPLTQLESWVSELDPALEYYVCCRSGMRSQRAVAELRRRGLSKVCNVRGGLQRWVQEVDPGFPLV